MRRQVAERHLRELRIGPRDGRYRGRETRAHTRRGPSHNPDSARTLWPSGSRPVFTWLTLRSRPAGIRSACNSAAAGAETRPEPCDHRGRANQPHGPRPPADLPIRPPRRRRVAAKSTSQAKQRHQADGSLHEWPVPAKHGGTASRGHRSRRMRGGTRPVPPVTPASRHHPSLDLNSRECNVRICIRLAGSPGAEPGRFQRMLVDSYAADHVARIPPRPIQRMKIPAEAGISKKYGNHLLSPVRLPSAVQA